MCGPLAAAYRGLRLRRDRLSDGNAAPLAAHCVGLEVGLESLSQRIGAAGRRMALAELSMQRTLDYTLALLRSGQSAICLLNLLTNKSIWLCFLLLGVAQSSLSIQY